MRAEHNLELHRCRHTSDMQRGTLEVSAGNDSDRSLRVSECARAWLRVHDTRLGLRRLRRRVRRCRRSRLGLNVIPPTDSCD